MGHTKKGGPHLKEKGHIWKIGQHLKKGSKF